MVVSMNWELQLCVAFSDLYFAINERNPTSFIYVFQAFCDKVSFTFAIEKA